MRARAQPERSCADVDCIRTTCAGEDIDEADSEIRGRSPRPEHPRARSSSHWSDSSRAEDPVISQPTFPTAEARARRLNNALGSTLTITKSGQAVERGLTPCDSAAASNASSETIGPLSPRGKRAGDDPASQRKRWKNAVCSNRLLDRRQQSSTGSARGNP